MTVGVEGNELLNKYKVTDLISVGPNQPWVVRTREFVVPPTDPSQMREKHYLKIRLNGDGLGKGGLVTIQERQRSFLGIRNRLIQEHVPFFVEPGEKKEKVIRGHVFTFPGS